MIRLSKPFVCFLLLVSGSVCLGQEVHPATPTATQLAFQDLELGAFIHYSIDPYAERNNAQGSTPAAAFNPTELDAEQWVLTAKSMGATFAVLTARHEEGFCLWPTKTTDYSIKSSPYKGGKGDIVREFVDACRKHGILPGLYSPPWIDSHWELSQPDLSPGWDRGRIDKLDNPAAYARALAKEQEQLRELMTNYGPLVFFWDDHFGRSDSLDTVPHGGPFREFYATMAKLAHELQPDCLYFGPDVEHVGNENGHSCYPMWNAVTTIDGTDDTISTTYKWDRDNSGDPMGKFYRPRLGSTTDGFSFGGWMWTGTRRPQSLERRMQVYYETIGRGAGILVNLTPDRRGLIPEDLVAAAKEMGDEIKRRFSNPIAQSDAKDPTQTLRFDELRTFDHIVTMEDLRDGQKVARYTLEAQVDGQWKTIVEGQTIGHKRIDQFAPVTTMAVRFTCTESIAKPVIMRSVAIFNASSKPPTAPPAAVASLSSAIPSVPEPAARVPKTSLGVTQLPNEKLDWFLDAKFGMFIHWGLYSGIGKGEWVMENQGIPPEKYRLYAYPESGEAYFDAADYHPEEWAKLAKDAGMKWMCLTARHHDGFCLFDSPHPNAFTSMQTLGRDLLMEYVKACRGREAGLKVGIYYSPLSWRYPGYYDVTGTNCLPNKFGYMTDPSHAENARLMKEENYVNVKKLLTGYGRIDHIYWDGGWLGQKGSDADAAFFHEPGRYLDPANQWPIPKQYQDFEEGTGKPLGIMGMVRKYQPDAITNLRYGWIGDVIEEEGSRETTGKIRSSEICDKNLTIQDGGWGYNAKSIAEGKVMSLDQLVRYMANCTVRNMTFLLNVTPDRHGVIPELEQQRLREMGAWMAKMGDSIYGTRGDPWQPVDRQYGYSYKNSTVFVHLLKDYPGNTFKMPPLGELRVRRVYEVYTGRPLPFEGDSDVTIRDIDRTSSPADSVIAVEYNDKVQRVWAK